MLELWSEGTQGKNNLPSDPVVMDCIWPSQTSVTIVKDQFACCAVSIAK